MEALSVLATEGEHRWIRMSWIGQRFAPMSLMSRELESVDSVDCRVSILKL